MAAGLHVHARRPPPPRGDRQGHAAVRLHDRAGAGRRASPRVGMDVLLFGPLPTPAVAMLTRTLRADLGRDDLRLAQPFRRQRHQAVRPRRLQALRRDASCEIEALMDERPAARPRRAQRARPRRSASTTPPGALHRVRQGAPSRAACAWTACASSSIAPTAPPTRSRPTVLWELGAEVDPASASTPDGFNINRGLRLHRARAPCSAQVTEHARRYRHRARRRRRPGGDVPTRRASIIDGDQILALIARSWAQAAAG